LGAKKCKEIRRIVGLEASKKWRTGVGLLQIRTSAVVIDLMASDDSSTPSEARSDAIKGRHEEVVARSPALQLALSLHRLTVRSLYRVARSEARYLSANCDISELACRFALYTSSTTSAMIVGDNGEYGSYEEESMTGLPFSYRDSASWSASFPGSGGRTKEEDGIFFPPSSKGYNFVIREGVNSEWISSCLAQRNPYASYPAIGALSILSTGSAKLEGKYHLVAERQSPTETTDIRNAEPFFVSYDLMLLEGRKYIREPSLSSVQKNSQATDRDRKQSSEETKSGLEIASASSFPSSSVALGESSGPRDDVHLRNLRAQLRRKFRAVSVEDSGSSVDAVGAVGFAAQSLINDFQKQLKAISRGKYRQSRLLQREFDKLKQLHKKSDTARIQHSKDKIKELWLAHPDIEV